MDKFFKWFQRMRDKMATPALREMTCPGNFRVEYPGGEHTFWMDYRSACNLREFCGGKVMHRNQLEDKQ